MKKVFTLTMLAINMFIANAAYAGEPDKEAGLTKMYWDAVKMYKEEDYSHAVLYFTHLAFQDPENYDYSYYTGMCYFHLNKPKMAKFYFNQLSDNNVYVLKIKVLSRIEDDMGVENPDGY